MGMGRGCGLRRGMLGGLGIDEGNNDRGSNEGRDERTCTFFYCLCESGSQLLLFKFLGYRGESYAQISMPTGQAV